MNLLELWRGTPQELKDIERARHLDENRRISDKEREKRLAKAYQTQRRILLRRIGMVVGGTTILAATGEISLATLGSAIGQPKELSSAGSIYDQLNSKKFENNFLPEKLTLAISQDLIAQTTYPSLVRSGRLLYESQENPHSMDQYDPLLVLSHSVGIGFQNLGRNVAKEISNGKMLAPIPIDLIKKDTGEVVNVPGINPDPAIISYYVALNNTLLGRASPWVYRLMVAKEVSHSFYRKQGRKFLLEELRQSYDFSNDRSIEDSLGSTALIAAYTNIKLPYVSPNFARLGDLIDFAGYGHIVLDLGLMKENGLLTETDKKILVYNLRSLEEGQNQGIIQWDKGSERFAWAAGVSPFSTAWFNVMEKVVKQ